jgi:hypothetical protein
MKIMVRVSIVTDARNICLCHLHWFTYINIQHDFYIRLCSFPLTLTRMYRRSFNTLPLEKLEGTIGLIRRPKSKELIIVEPTNSVACLKIELIGCAVQGNHISS